MIRGAIFDFDGTLMDSMPAWETSGDIFLLSVGKEPEPDLQKVLKPMSPLQSAEYLQQTYGLSLSLEAIMAGVNRTVEDAYFHTVQPKEGVIPFLEQLKARGVRMCIATATDRYLVEAAVRRCGMDRFFSAIFTCSDVGHGKDEPVIFRRAMAHLQTSREDTFVFEDALHALRTAHEDGFRTVAVYDPSEERQKALRETADLFLENYHNMDPFWKFVTA